MKKIKYLVVVLLAVLFVTGCGNTKTLTCTNKGTEDGMEMAEKVTFKFNGDDKVTSVKLAMDMKLANDEYKSYWSQLVSTLDTVYKTSDVDGIKVTTKNNEKTYTYSLTIDVDLEKAKPESLALYDIDDIAESAKSYDDVKKSAEEAGFTCK